MIYTLVFHMPMELSLELVASIGANRMSAKRKFFNDIADGVIIALRDEYIDEEIERFGALG